MSAQPSLAEIGEAADDLPRPCRLTMISLGTPFSQVRAIELGRGKGGGTIDHNNVTNENYEKRNFRGNRSFKPSYEFSSCQIFVYSGQSINCRPEKSGNRVV